MAQSRRERIVEKLVEARLRTHGGVLITGPKAVGKTTTARSFAASEVRLDQDPATLAAAQTDPRLVLDGERPRLIDEYQLAGGIWNAVRGRIDDLGGKGLFLLTGSSTPESEERSHTGARRIAAVPMRTMTLQERGLSSGLVSVGALLDGATAGAGKRRRARAEPSRFGVPRARRPAAATAAESRRFGVAEAIEALAVGGWPDNLALVPADALDANADYLDVIVHADVQRVDGIRRDPEGLRRLRASYARNVATAASLRTIARTAERPLGEATLHDYLRALGRLYLIEDQPSWKPALRSRVRLAATPKRHLADPSLAVAALGTTPQRLLGPEIELAGFLFESQAVHDLRVYAQPHRAEVRFYRDNKALEVDAIVEARDGRWIGVEVKLGHHRVDDGARNLLALREKLSPAARDACGALVVAVADSPTYTRPDGVLVTSIASLGP
jgi:predicted AAA+ superfamily ATPase